MPIKPSIPLRLNVLEVYSLLIDLEERGKYIPRTSRS